MSATSRTVSLIRVNEDWATRLFSTPILISEVTASASRVSEAIVPAISPVAARVSWASFLTSAATTAKRAARLARARRLDRRVEREHVGLAGDRLDARGDLLHLRHRLGEAGHALAQLDDEVGEPREDLDRVLDRGAALVELAARLLGEHARLVGGIGDLRLVGEQPGGDVLERIEHLEIGGDALVDAGDIAGDVAAFDRQRPAIARDLVDRLAVGPLARAACHRASLLLLCEAGAKGNWLKGR